MAVAVLGAVADAVGLAPTLTFLFLLPLAGLGLAAGVPETGRARARSAG
jgi:hypothetical protein